LKHNKKEKLCPYFLAGFCPEGKACKNGTHAKFPMDLKKPEVRVEKTKEELDQERAEREAQREREDEQERERDERLGNTGGGHKFGRGNWHGGDRKKGGRGRGRHRRGGY
jgi:cleavage and polyadenylation specificity factor subunit 4